MKLTVKNLGVIKKGEVQLDKDLIIFTGENNSGKSYMSYVVYGLRKTIEEIDGNILQITYREMLSDLLVKNKSFEPYFTKIGIRIDMNEFWTNNYKYHREAREKSLNNHLNVVFAKDMQGTQIQLLAFNQKPKPRSFRMREVNINNKKFIDRIENGIRELFCDDYDVRDNDKIIEFCCLDIYIRETQNTMFFPAERAGIYLLSGQDASMLVGLGALLGSPLKFATSQFVSNLPIPKYPLHISHHKDFVNGLQYIAKQKIGIFSYLASDLETIIGGQLSISQYKSIEFTPQDSKHKLELSSTSSSVKSLAGLVIYLRYLAKKGDEIIIDEPEISLHPNNQILIARFIAQMINAGLKVLISTHSDYIIRELNNLIMLNVKENEEDLNNIMNKYGYLKEQLLDFNKVGAYFFTSEIQALEVTNTGFEIQSIDNAINQLNNSANDIFFTLHDND